MNWIITNVVAPLAVATTMTFAGSGAATAQSACMSNVEVQAAIARGDIAPVARVLQNAGIDRNTQVLSVEVCQSGSGWAYYVGVIDASGQARTLVLQASG